jgi:hypothetical protein
VLTLKVGVYLHQLIGQQPPQLPTLLTDGVNGLSDASKGPARAAKQALQQVRNLQ